MEMDEFKKVITEFVEKNCYKLMFGEKNIEYSRGGDKLHNFKKAGRRRGKSPEEALSGMLEKHLTSIDDMIQDLEFAFQEKLDYQVNLNMWKEKLRDTINYYLLLWALLVEREKKEKVTTEGEIVS